MTLYCNCIVRAYYIVGVYQHTHDTICSGKFCLYMFVIDVYFMTSIGKHFTLPFNKIKKNCNVTKSYFYVSKKKPKKPPTYHIAKLRPKKIVKTAGFCM